MKIFSQVSPTFTCASLLLVTRFFVIDVHGHGASHIVKDEFDVSPIAHISPLTPIRARKLKLLRKRDIDHIPRGHHYHSHDHGLQLSFSAYNQSFLLDLEPHLDVLHHEAKVTVYDGNTEQRMNLPYYVYSGKVFAGKQNIERGWARIVLLEPELQTLDERPMYEGVFTFGKTSFTVRSSASYRRLKRAEDVELDPTVAEKHTLVVYSDQKHMPNWEDEEKMRDLDFGLQIQQSQFKLQKRDNITVPAATCNLAPDMWPEDKLSGGSRLYRRQNGCPASRKILYMSAAVDCTYFRWHETPERVLKQVIANWASASKVYEQTVNVGLSLIHLEIQKSCNSNPAWNRECSSSYSIESRLNDFSRWRADSRKGDSSGLWHLLTACASGTSLGVAWPRTLCKQTLSSGSDASTGTGVSSMGKEEWKIVAHEIGHNFGARHDCTSDVCKSGSAGGNTCCPCTSCDCQSRYIMNPTDGSTTTSFSPCSISDMCTTISQASCLLDASSFNLLPTIRQRQCGNGIKEEGEECDSGVDEDACCDRNCRLKTGATCSDKNDECCNQCRIASAGTVCRAARSTLCDVAETCNGVLASCPADSYKANGGSCELSGAQCADGLCTSRNLQCVQRKGDLKIYGACTSYQAMASCELSCDAGDGKCATLTGYFYDGLPCGYKSTCLRGKCVAPNFVYGVINWGYANPIWAIVILVVVILIVVATIYFSVRFCIRRRRTKKSQESASAGLSRTLSAQEPLLSMSQRNVSEPRRSFIQAQHSRRSSSSSVRSRQNSFGLNNNPSMRSAQNSNVSTPTQIVNGQMFEFQYDVTTNSFQPAGAPLVQTQYQRWAPGTGPTDENTAVTTPTATSNTLAERTTSVSSLPPPPVPAKKPKDKKKQKQKKKKIPKENDSEDYLQYDLSEPLINENGTSTPTEKSKASTDEDLDSTVLTDEDLKPMMERS